MDKITVSTQELAAIPRSVEVPIRMEPKLPPVIPWWAKLAFSCLALILPLLCLVAIVLRASIRNQPPRIKHEWTAFLATLLIISGFLTSASAVLMISFVPLPAVVSKGLSDLDERAIFPHLPATAPMSGVTIAAELKPLVAVVTPAQRLWFSHQETTSGILGAGVLLQATDQGYLFATARHVVDGVNWRFNSHSRALVAMASGAWAGADVIGRHATLDLLLLWVPRESGHSDFTLPIASASDGETIFVIGHPEGLKYTLSNGMVSRMDQGPMFQISAPVSPGNSGGPVFDNEGNLVGIVTSKMDRSVDPNAENLNFAVRADTLLNSGGWRFVGNGQERLGKFADSIGRAHAYGAQSGEATQTSNQEKAKNGDN
jgi:S1-C subfamily serine protease